jgi:hypothetical protein
MQEAGQCHGVRSCAGLPLYGRRGAGGKVNLWHCGPTNVVLGPAVAVQF